MSAEHPITPPPELVQQWTDEAWKGWRGNGTYERDLAAQASRWGADTELEACCEWVSQWRCMVGGNRPEVGLRAARRPKPPSLKEQAKFAAAVLGSPDENCSIAELQQHWHTICCALEQLDD